MLVSEILINSTLKKVHTDVKCRVKLLGIGVEKCKSEEEYNAYVNALEWQTGIIEATPTMLIGMRGVAQFRREDDFLFPAQNVADYEVLTEKVIAEEIDYSKQIAWIYQSNGVEIPIYLGDIVKLKISEFEYVEGKVQYAEDIQKYYVQGVSTRHFFYFNCEVEKMEVCT